MPDRFHRTVRSCRPARTGKPVRIAPGIRDFPDRHGPEHGKATVTSATISTGRASATARAGRVRARAESKGRRTGRWRGCRIPVSRGKKAPPPERLPPADSHAGTFVYIFLGCAVPFFRTCPFARERLSCFAGRAGFRRFSFASLFLLRFLAILPGRTCCGRRRCFARLLPGLRSTALPRTQCHGRSGGIPSLAAAMPPTVASLTPPRCSYLVHTGTCCGLAGGRSGLFRSANAAAPCFPRLFRDRFLSKSPHRFSLQS